MSSTGTADVVALHAQGMRSESPSLSGSPERQDEDRQATNEANEQDDDNEEEEEGTQGLGAQAVGFMRKYLGEQVTAALLAQKEKVEDEVKAKVKSGVKKTRNEVSQHLHAGGRHIFEALFPRNEEASITSPLWAERSGTWADCMEPQGRHWFSLALPSSHLDEQVDLSFAFDESVRLDDDMEHQIQLDLPRTYPSIEEFEDPSLLLSLERVLRATALTCPEVGYVQGMNFLVGYLILHCKTEDLAHRLTLELLSNPKYNLRGVFEEGLPTLRKLGDALKHVVKEKDAELFDHMEAEGIEEFFFAFQWISTLFAYSMPFDALQYVWDMFFEFSWEGFFKVCLVLMQDRREELLKQDFDDICATLKQCVINPREDFYIRARSISFTPSTLAIIKAAALT